ncbi:MAG: hypothetical protein IIX48_01115 [Lachnospiraceae bacterium]|nr:hypothetical protein [Lachnospiraceae bacterium]
MNKFNFLTIFLLLFLSFSFQNVHASELPDVDVDVGVPVDETLSDVPVDDPVDETVSDPVIDENVDSQNIALCTYYLEQISNYEFGSKEYHDAVLLYLQSYQTALGKLDNLSSISSSLSEIHTYVKGSINSGMTNLVDTGKKEYKLLSDMYDLLKSSLSDQEVTEEEAASMEAAIQAELDFRSDLLAAVNKTNEILVSQNGILQEQNEMLSDFLNSVSENSLDTLSENSINALISTPLSEYDLTQSLLLLLFFLGLFVVFILLFHP